MKASQLIGCRAGICAILAAGVIGAAAGAGPSSGAVAHGGASGARGAPLAHDAAATSSTPGAVTGTNVFAAAQTAAAGGATDVATAINVNGNSLIAWDDETGLGHTYVRTAGDKGILGALQTLWIGAGYDVAASLASDGTGAVSWLSGQSLLAAVAQPGHGFATPQALASSIDSAIGTQTVVATPGRAVALWLATPSSGASAIDYAIAGSAGKFGSSKSLGTTDIQPPLLAAYDAAGDVIVAYWTAPSTSTEARAGAAAARAASTASSKPTKKPTKPKPSNASKPTGQLAYVVLPAGSNTFSAPQTIATLTGKVKPSANVTMASGPGGVAVGYTGNFFNVAPLGATGPVGSTQKKAGAVPTAAGTGTAGPTVAVPAQGGTVAAWSENTAPKGSSSYTTGHIVVSQQQTTGTFTPQDLTASSTLSQSPLAAATKDLAILVFGAGPESNELLDYSVRQAGGSFSTPQPLSSTALLPPVTAPSTTSVMLQPIPASLAANGTHAVVAWLDGETLLASFLTG